MEGGGTIEALKKYEHISQTSRVQKLTARKSMRRHRKRGVTKLKAPMLSLDLQKARRLIEHMSRIEGDTEALDPSPAIEGALLG